jgi:hypothetical protein
MLNDKDVITALATITVSRKKSLLYLIAKNVTVRVESSQLVRHPGHQSDRSRPGFTTTGTFMNYVHWLRGQYPDTAPIHLILTIYSVHCCEASRTCAVELGIVLHFIPAGWTDELQLLDRYAFGVLKSICRGVFACYCMAAENTIVCKADAARFLIEACGLLEVAVIEKGWGCMRTNLMIWWMTMKKTIRHELKNKHTSQHSQGTLLQIHTTQCFTIDKSDMRWNYN